MKINDKYKLNDNYKNDLKIVDHYCKQYMFGYIPPVLDFPINGKVVAIGDIHGDINMLISILKKLK